MSDKLMTVEEISKYLDMHPITIYKMIKTGALPGFKIGGRWRFNKVEIQNWLSQKMNRPETEPSSSLNP